MTTPTPIIAVMIPRHREIVPILNEFERMQAITILMRVFSGRWPHSN